MIVRQSAKGTAWDDHCPQSELSYAVRATWSSTSDPDCESLCTYYVYCHQVIDKSQATQKQTHNKDDSSSCSQKKIWFKNHLRTILNNYRNMKKNKSAFQILNPNVCLVFCTFSLLLLISIPLFKPSSSHCLSFVWLGFIGLSVIPCNCPRAKYSGRLLGM